MEWWGTEQRGICYAVESEWEQGHRHHTYCIYYSSKTQGSEGKEEMDKRVKGEIIFFTEGRDFEA